MPSLEQLSLNLYSTSSLDGLVDALAAGALKEEGKACLCPELKALQFLESAVGGRSLRGLVASRAAQITLSSESEEVVQPNGKKLVSLDIRGALGAFLWEDESWLRSRVGHFTGRDDEVSSSGYPYRRVRGDV